MKHLCGVMAMVLSMLYAFPQSKLPASKSNTGVLSIGDTLPALTIQVLDNGNIQTSNTTSFKGKWLLLDFWATWCTSCLHGFSKLNSFQKKYGNNLQVLLLNAASTGDTKAKVTSFYISWIKQHPDFRLPTILLDSLLSTRFQYRMIPHTIWVDDHGIIRAITAAKEVTEENIEAMLTGTKKNLPEKRDIMDFDPAQDQLLSSRVIYGSAIGGPIDGISSKNGTVKDSRNQVTKIYAFNQSLLQLYQQAIWETRFWPMDRFDLQVKDTAHWLNAYVYSYEQRMSPLAIDSARTKMKTDLDRLLNVETFFSEKNGKRTLIIRELKQDGLFTSKQN